MSRHTQDEVRIRERHEEKGKQGREKKQKHRITNKSVAAQRKLHGGCVAGPLFDHKASS